MDNLHIFLLSSIIFLSYLCYNSYFISNSINIEEFRSNEEDYKYCQTVLTIYDKFYSNIYDELFLSKFKNQYEILQLNELILKKWINKDTLRILDIGCGTGHHVNSLENYKYNVIGLDISKDMIQIAKKQFPKCDWIVGDILNPNLFQPKRFSHATCFFYTFYYLKDINLFFKNINNWLHKKGVLIIHIIDKTKFDPVLEKASSIIPLYNPQKLYRKTESKLVFNNFNYSTNWYFSEHDDKPTKFIETFRFKNKLRRNVHKFYILSMKQIVDTANNFGFKLTDTIDLTIANHPYNYLLCFKKIYGD